MPGNATAYSASGLLRIRSGSSNDLPILEAMLLEAFYWSPRAPRAERAELDAHPDFRKLLAEWGDRQGDTAVIAELRDNPIGAAWYRFWSPAVHSYGFVDSSIPEVAMGVAPEHRSRGVGRSLLEALVSAARHRRVPALSLSVDPDNFALQLYRSLGFRPVGKSGTSLTLLLEL